MAGRGGLVVAFDHAPLGLFPGLRSMSTAVSTVAACGPDGVILNLGPMKRFGAGLSEAGIMTILRLDGNRTHLAGDWTTSDEWEMFYSAETAARVGATGVIVNLLLGCPAELASIRVVAAAAAAAHDAGLRLYVSSIVLGKAYPKEAAFGARYAFELGADVVNLYGAAEPRLVEDAASWCGDGVLLAQGAPKVAGADAVAGWAAASLAAGASGVCVGEAVWGAADPVVVMSALRAVTPPVG